MIEVIFMIVILLYIGVCCYKSEDEQRWEEDTMEGEYYPWNKELEEKVGTVFATKIREFLTEMKKMNPDISFYKHESDRGGDFIVGVNLRDEEVMSFNYSNILYKLIEEF